MVKIPNIEDPTLRAMKEACEAAQENKSRDYLGASLIGNECERQIWYEFNKYEREPFKAKTLWNFEDGHRTEDLIAGRLRMVDGVELWTHDESGNQFGFSDMDGMFAGHIDGVIRGLRQAPRTLHIWENKSCGQKKFDEFTRLKMKLGEKNTLKSWNKNYYTQAQLYMHYFGMARHYMTVALAGGRDIDSCRTEYVKGDALAAISKARDIIGATEAPPRISEKVDFFMCRWCDFKDTCHG